MQSVPITTEVVSSNPAHGDVYSIQHCAMQFVSDLQRVGFFSPGIPISSTNKTDSHWNIVERGIKQHNPQHHPILKFFS